MNRLLIARLNRVNGHSPCISQAKRILLNRFLRKDSRNRQNRAYTEGEARQINRQTAKTSGFCRKTQLFHTMSMDTEGIAVTEGSFKNKDGLMIFTRIWKAKQNKPPKALIFVAHGFGEHSDRYSDFLAPGLVAEDFVVFSHDHVGHGRSEGERAQIDTFETYVRDVLYNIDQAQLKYPAIPVFIFGHSMGGLIAILTAMQRPKLFAGVVLIAPPLVVDPKKDNKCMRFLGKMVVFIAPGVQVIAGVDPNTTTRNPEKVASYANDPLVWHGDIKAGWGVALAHAVDKIQESMEDIEWPFMILQGTADAISMSEGAVQLEKRAKSTDKTIKMYDEYYHELLNEPREYSTIVLDDIKQWLRERIPTD